MENNFDQLQKLWQNQTEGDLDVSHLLSGLKKTEAKQRRELIALLICTPLTVGILFWLMPWRESLAIAISLCIIAFAMLGILALILRSKLTKNDSSETLNNTEYLTIQIKKLKRQYTIARKHMYSYTLLLLLALNLGYFVILEPFSDPIRISIHVVLSLIIATFMHWQIRKKVKKYDQDLKPMIEQMEKILAEKQAS